MELTGIIKARAVQAKAPVKFIKSPNFGMAMAEYPVAMTMIVLKTRVFSHLNFSPKILGSLSKKLLLSTMSKAGMTWIG